ncbi:hypothetical protein G6O67_003173 [Ophiocordyceps sinensis]|uniref:Uncharacterized protein n=1 Tax=Ophiocordyceps sinensis TaxID=72228 RepID=A0A8H4V811_9HYPO|nr:hypothetical protein G6O67_003173 [Ophiocordyceps sinensis]
MAQDQDALHKVGRGGAGNYHPTSAPSPATCKPPAPEPAIVAAPDAPGPLRGGRGGAGNFVDPGESAREVGAAVLAANRSRRQQGRGGRGRAMGGRGGAGNWAGRSVAHYGGDRDDDDDDEYDYVDYEWDEVHGPHAQKVEALERKVKEVVDKGLRMPDKVHHGRDRSGHE